MVQPGEDKEKKIAESGAKPSDCVIVWEILEQPERKDDTLLSADISQSSKPMDEQIITSVNCFNRQIRYPHGGVA